MTTPRVTVAVGPTEAMRLVPDRVLTETLYWMARAYERVHSMPRVSDTELANKIEAAKADLGRARDASPILSNSPAPAPEGGAVETAVKIATDLHHAYEQLIYGLPKYLEAENLTDEENMIREAWITLDVTAHRLAALATREEAPAEAGEDWSRDDIETLISDALTDSFDVDWDAGDGAMAVLRALEKEGLLLRAQPPARSGEGQ